jgi:hypothetical protein
MVPDEKRVVVERVFGRGFTDDRAVLHAPELLLTAPAVERLTVEQRTKAGFVVGEAVAERQCERERSDSEAQALHEEYLQMRCRRRSGCA